MPSDPKILNPEGLELLLLGAQTVKAWREIGRIDVADMIMDSMAKTRGVGPKLQAELDAFLFAPMDFEEEGDESGVLG